MVINTGEIRVKSPKRILIDATNLGEKMQNKGRPLPSKHLEFSAQRQYLTSQQGK